MRVGVAAAAASLCVLWRSHEQPALNPHGVCCCVVDIAEHFVAFLMNYQDPASGRNKYIDRLVRLETHD